MQTIDRAFAVLRALASHTDTSTLSDVSRDAGLPKSTTSRILGALDNLGVVDRVGDRYAIGSGLATLTHAATPIGALRELARPYLNDLADALGENASLAIGDGNAALYIDTIVGEGEVQLRDWTGERVPYHASAAGLALMSTWPDKRIDEYAAVGLDVLTEATITSASALRERIREVRAAGVGWTFAEFSDEVNGVAAPILRPDGRATAALSVYGPVYRFPGDRSPTDTASLVVDASTQVARRLTT